MKKLRILAVLLVLAVAITGCKGPSMPVPGNANHLGLEQETVLSGTVSDGENRWDYRITTYTVTGEHCADDGSRRVLTRHSYQTPAMEVMSADGGKSVSSAAAHAADAFNAYFQQVLQDEVAWFDEMAVAADEDYRTVGKEHASMWGNEEFCYSDDATLDFWSNGRLVCVITTRSSYTGGAHPNTWRSGVTFDLRTGRIVTPADLADDLTGMQSAVDRELMRQAEERQRAAEDESLVYYEDYPETLEAWMDRSVIFDDEGMTVIFGVYDIAAYSAGEQSFLIPYTYLAPYLSDFGRSVLELPE